MASKKKTLVINLFGGPGVGKSAFALRIASDLKFLGIDCEYSPEYAKDVVWEESYTKLEHQIYIFGKQIHRLQRLDGKLDVVVTDAPLLHSALYCEETNTTFRQLILEEHKKFNNLNYYITRGEGYDPNGRTQSLEEAILMDGNILEYLNKNSIKLNRVKREAASCDSIVKDIIESLKMIKQEEKEAVLRKISETYKAAGGSQHLHEGI